MRYGEVIDKVHRSAHTPGSNGVRDGFHVVLGQLGRVVVARTFMNSFGQNFLADLEKGNRARCGELAGGFDASNVNKARNRTVALVQMWERRYDSRAKVSPG